MKIPFDVFRLPKARAKRLKLLERFEAEFGDDYELDAVIDPIFDMHHVYKYKSIEEKLERLERRYDLVMGLKKAIANNDKKKIDTYNSCRFFPILPQSDNGWNWTPATKQGIQRDWSKFPGGCPFQ